LYYRTASEEGTSDGELMRRSPSRGGKRPSPMVQQKSFRRLAIQEMLEEAHKKEDLIVEEDSEANFVIEQQ